MKESIYIGQRLKTLTNEYVTVKKIEAGFIYVSYKHKTYKRGRDIIGKKLFTIENEIEKSAGKLSKTSAKEIESPQKKTCENCMGMRKGECFGDVKICEFFRYVPSKGILPRSDWPKMGDASRYRMRYRKK